MRPVDGCWTDYEGPDANIIDLDGVLHTKGERRRRMFYRFFIRGGWQPSVKGSGSDRFPCKRVWLAIDPLPLFVVIDRTPLPYQLTHRGPAGRYRQARCHSEERENKIDAATPVFAHDPC